jgi:FKBP-type peptidyl-prolyl cis-trans isomerase
MTFAVVADSFFFKTAFAEKLPGFTKAGDPFYYDVKLVSLLTDEELNQELEAERQIYQDKEQEVLNAYLKENNISTKPLESGLYFIPVKEGKGQRPDTGDMCRIYLEVKEIGGKNLYSNFDQTPIDVEFGKQFDTEGLMQGISLLKPGGRAKLIVPSPIGVGETGKETVGSFTTILYDVELIEIKTVDEVKQERKERKAALEAEKDRIKDLEPERMQAYIQKNNITALPTSSGLYFLTLEKGSGLKPIAGDTIKLYYTVGKTDGRLIYDSHEKGEPIEFILGQGLVVKAWDEGITYMARGGKYKLLAPSKLAYGRKGQGDLIGPYEPLVYEIELLDNE